MKKHIFFAILFLLSLTASSSWATTYYVDALAGSDANAGTSPSVAWQTAQKVSNSTFAAGDIIAFHAGQDFRSTSPTGNTVNGSFVYVLKPGAVGTWTGTSTHPVTITSYGDDNWNNPAWLDATVCRGLNIGRCSTSTAVNWSINSGAIYQIPDATIPLQVLTDGETGTLPKLQAATCLTGVCSSLIAGAGNPVPAGNLPLWQGSNHVYAANSAVVNGIAWYLTVAGGTQAGTSPPTCLTGTCTVGGVTWAYEGPAAGSVLAMQPGTWFNDGTNLYVWMPDGSNPSNHVVETSDAQYGLWFNATSTELNYITVDHLGFRGGCQPIQYADASSSQAPLGQVVKNSFIYYAGTGSVDTGLFCNSITWQPTKGTTTATQSDWPLFKDNVIAFSSHGGITPNQQGDHLQIIGNDISHAIHGDITMPIGLGTAFNNPVIDSNRLHDNDEALFAHGGTISSSVGGVYCENCVGGAITNNFGWRISDAVGCTAVADCSAVWLNGGSGNSVFGNAFDNVYQGFAETNSGTTGLFVGGNTWVLTPNPTVNSYVYQFVDTSPTPLIDNDYVIPQGGSAAFNSFYNGSAQSLAQLQALGFDVHVQSSIPTSTKNLLSGYETQPNPSGYTIASIAGQLGQLGTANFTAYTTTTYNWNLNAIDTVNIALTGSGPQTTTFIMTGGIDSHKYTANVCNNTTGNNNWAFSYGGSIVYAYSGGVLPNLTQSPGGCSSITFTYTLTQPPLTLTESALVPVLPGVVLTNDAAGTTCGNLVKYTSTNTVKTLATTDSDGAIGVAIAGCGTSGLVYVQQYGIVTMNMDGNITSGDYVIPSTTTGGDGHDSGLSGFTLPTSGGTVGIVISPTSGSAGAYQVLLLYKNAGPQGDQTLLNDAAGTTLNHVVVITATDTLTNAGASDLYNPAGVLFSGAGTSGVARFRSIGLVAAGFDGATTTGHLAAVSTTSPGFLHDIGPAGTFWTGSKCMGVIEQTIGGAGAALVFLEPCPSGGNPALQSQPYDLGFSLSGTPSASQIFPYVCPRALNFPGNFTSSTWPDATARVSCGTSPSETDGYIIKVAGTEIGAICLSTSCVATLCTGAACTATCTGGTGATQTCTAGQRFELDAPATVSGANIAITIPSHSP